MKYLKYFETKAEYNSATLELPNVSFVEETKIVSYNPGSSASSDYVMVDLGLPSGLLWADRNVGASSPEEYGLYFQWGDTVGYTIDQAGKDKVFDSANYWDSVNGSAYDFNKYSNNTNNLTVLEASDDAARVNMGSDWRMPTQTEMQELIDNTTPTFIDLQGNEFSESEAQFGAIAKYNLKGVRFTGSNGNSIFIPASGYCIYSTFDHTDHVCLLWLSDFYSSPMFWTGVNLRIEYAGGIYTTETDRYFGHPVRGVCSK